MYQIAKSISVLFKKRRNGRNFIRQACRRDWCAIVAGVVFAVHVGQIANAEEPLPQARPFPTTESIEFAAPKVVVSDSASKIDLQLQSANAQDRREALQLLTPDRRTNALREVVKQLAEQDEDAVVRSRAEFLLADWLESAAKQETQLAPATDTNTISNVQTAAAEWTAHEDAQQGKVRVVADEEIVPKQPEIVFPRPRIALESSGLSAVPPLPLFAESAGGEDNQLTPEVLNRPLDGPAAAQLFPEIDQWDGGLLQHKVDAPLGFTGPSSILPEDVQEDAHFVPMPDRWRSGFPEWDRYQSPDKPRDNYIYTEGHWWDPYNQNVLKGDYPIIGQHTFFKLTAESLLIHEYRQLPTPTTPFESTVDPFQEEFFGDPNQYFTTNNLILSFELFHGSAGFKPFDWMVRLTPIFNMNYLDVNELGIVSPDVRRGTQRYRQFAALEEYFVEAKLFDISPEYDFVSARVGSQPFVSDFRGFIFADINRGVRLFGTRLANRDQFNIIYFDQTEKDTNSQLNTFEDRKQNTLIANYYRQDFIFPGYTGQMSVHYNRDGPDFKFDENRFLARPDAAGNFEPHKVEAVYLGAAGEGHIGKINVANAFYWALGEDSQNPITGTRQNINAKMAALELSFDRDWVRFRGSVFWASGDDDPKDTDAEGFDSIFDNPEFAGGEFSFWQRQEIRLFGVGLVNRQSIVPDMRSSKFQGQPNFVNPGLLLLNLGMDFEVTPKLRFITNANYLEFDNTEVLTVFTFQDNIDKTIGVDLSIGMEYRPLLNDNIVIEAGYAALIPGRGFKDLYGKTEPFTTANAGDIDADTLHSVFLQTVLLY